MNKLSIVSTMYYSAPYLPEFYRRCREVALQVAADYEFVLVNDGSPDEALAVALALRGQDSRVRVVDLSRNFGHHRAMMIGLHYAQGDWVFLLDCDLEEPPEALLALYQALQNQGADVAYGVQQKRHEPWLRRHLARAYYALFNFLSDIPITPHLLTLRLMSRRYVQALIQHREQVFSIEGLWQNTGFVQVPVQVNKLSYKGQTSYTLARRLALSFNAITAFSSKPLILIASLGVLILIPSGLGVFYLVLVYVFSDHDIEGWASLIVSIWFLSGLIILLLGIIAFYLAVIFQEIKARPYAIIRQLYEDPPS
jgi:putative glycosyltransferase